MLGTQMQEVPKYSAVKVDGKRLYKYARQGLEENAQKRNHHLQTSSVFL